MADRDMTRERDILVAPQEYAYVQDLTKGDIVLYVGPTKISLSNTERLVEYYNDRFVPVRGEDPTSGVRPFVVASSSQYIILENPPRDATIKPSKGANSAIEVLTGRKIVVPGPATFPLWAGQKAIVIGGHELRENQYLVVKVYDKVEGDDSPIGTEQIVRGCDVSFYIPRTGLEVVPDEHGSYVRNACHLKRGMGIHLRVVKDFQAVEGDQVPPGSYRAGQELFVHDREGYFFPTEAVQVVEILHAIPVADREGIYVRDIESGHITTEVGPQNFLPDPTRVEIIDRELDPEREHLYRLEDGRDPGKAVTLYIPPSFAVLVTAANKREVVQGPQTRVLAFDEDLEVLHLSTGKPKNEETLLATCFLQTDGNKVSDIVRVRTSDHVELDLMLSYRVSFMAKEPAERERWFRVNNYVGLLCDHLGSIVRAAVRATPIDAFHSRSTDVVRNAILGEKKGDEKRTGRHFEENHMWVYDVEVLDVRILDADVKKLLSDAQRTAIVFEVEGKQEHMRLSHEKLKEDVNRQIYEAQQATVERGVSLERARKALSLSKAEVGVEIEHLQTTGKARNQAEALAITRSAEAEAAARDAELELTLLKARVDAFRQQMESLHPELIATLKMMGDRQVAGELTRNLSPLAILGGNSVAEVAERLLQGLPINLSLGLPTPR